MASAPSMREWHAPGVDNKLVLSTHDLSDDSRMGHDPSWSNGTQGHGICCNYREKEDLIPLGSWVVCKYWVTCHQEEKAFLGVKPTQMETEPRGGWRGTRSAHHNSTWIQLYLKTQRLDFKYFDAVELQLAPISISNNIYLWVSPCASNYAFYTFYRESIKVLSILYLQSSQEC